MSNPRISGQDTEITVLVDGEPVSHLTAVKSFDVTYKMTTKSEDYVGESSPRKDDFFEGLSGRVEIDMEGIEALELVEAIKTRAQNRAISTKIAIKSTLQFPDGDRAIINVPNVFFSDIPLNFGSRTDYGRMTLAWEAENGRIISR